MSQVLQANGSVWDLTPLETSSNVADRVMAYTVLQMDAWASAHGYNSYQAPPDASTAELDARQAAWSSFYNQGLAMFNQPSQATTNALQQLTTSGDLVRQPDGSFRISNALAADIINFGVANTRWGKIPEALAIIAKATMPDTAQSFAQQVRDSDSMAFPKPAPTVSTPQSTGPITGTGYVFAAPPGAGGSGPSAMVPVSNTLPPSVVNADAGGVSASPSTSVTNAPSTSTSTATPPGVQTVGASSAPGTVEARTKQLLLLGAGVVVLLVLLHKS